jgi:hypothetical protein
LAEKDVYNIQSKNRVYFLELLENHENREYVSIDNPNITIEHIFPQTPDEKWYEDLDPETLKTMEEVYLNTIANLTLSGNNGSLSNKSFQEKKAMNRDGKEQGYEYSRLWLNQYLKSIDEWNLDRLNARYKLLLDRFYQIWVYPEVEPEDDFDTDEDYTIYNAPDPRFKKLDYFIFKDEKIVTQEVSKMYYHVIKTLFDENPSAFYHQDVKDLLGLSTNPSELRSPGSISHNYYYESNIDNNSKFRRLKTLLTKFDCEEELLINFSDYEPGELPEETIDKQYWIRNADDESMLILDECEKVLKGIDEALNLNYTKKYIGVSKNMHVENFIIFMPKKGFVRTLIRLDHSEDWLKHLEENGLDFLSIGKRGRLKFRIRKRNIINDTSALEEIFRNAYESWMK